MATTMKKKDNRKWTVFVDTHINGVRFKKTKSFDSRAEANDWRLEIERQIINSREATRGAPTQDIKDFFHQHRALVYQVLSYCESLPAHGPKVKERNRLMNLVNLAKTTSGMNFLGKRPEQITVRDARAFITFRGQMVSGESIRKELTQLSHVYASYGEKFEKNNPFKEVDRPKASKYRTQRLKKPMENKLLRFFKSSSTKSAHRIAIVIAVETAMRAGELFSVTWSQVDLKSRTIYLEKTKNGHERTVPLTRRATRYLKILRAIQQNSNHEGMSLANTPIFGITRDGFLSTWQRHLRELKKVNPDFSNLRFHDLRHEATSRFFEKRLSAPEVQLITGHKTLAMLSRYTHLDARNLVSRIG